MTLDMKGVYLCHNQNWSDDIFLKPHGLNLKQTAGSKLIIPQQNENNQWRSSHMLQVQSNKKQILWFTKIRVQDNWPLCVFYVLHGKRCKPSWTWQAWSTWPQVTDGYKFYRDTHRVWQRKRGKCGNLVSSGWEVLEKMMRARLLKESLYSCSMHLSGVRIRDLPSGPEDRTVKVERRVQGGRGGGGCGGIV